MQNKVMLGKKYNNLPVGENNKFNEDKIKNNINSLIKEVMRTGKRKTTISNNDIYDKIKSQISNNCVR